MLAKKILVTGCGGDIGYIVGYILKQAGVAEKVIGTDIAAGHTGEGLFDACRQVMPASSPGYLDNLQNIIKQENIDVLIPGSEPELRTLLAAGLTERIAGIPVVAANAKALTIGFDKLATAQYLAAVGLPAPWTKLVAEGEPDALPCIVKDRVGSGSRGFAVVHDELDVKYFSQKRPDAIWQQYLGTDDQEYTCGLYRTGGGEIRTIIIRRRLQGGHTHSGEIIADSRIERALTALATSLDLQGSINVQLRLTSEGPFVFEINPRFSSTVGFRNSLGFCDLLWALAEKCGQPPDKYIEPEAGTRFFRTYCEKIILPRGG